MFPGLNREGPRNTPKVDKRKTILTHIGVKRCRMMFVGLLCQPFLLHFCVLPLPHWRWARESRRVEKKLRTSIMQYSCERSGPHDPPCAQEPQLRYRDELLLVAEDTDAMVIRPFDRLDLFCRC